MEFDCFISCERAGSADDGKYHKMSGDVMPTASIDRVEDIWYRAIDLGIPTVAIGEYFFLKLLHQRFQRFLSKMV